MATIYSEVDQEQGLLLTVSDFKTDKFKYRIGCAITGNFLRGGEGYSSLEDAKAKMKTALKDVCI